MPQLAGQGVTGAALAAPAQRNAVVHRWADVEAPTQAAAPRRLAAHPEEAWPLLLT